MASPSRWRAPPQRIVSLLPSLTETVCELGQCQRLVGVDRYSNWPASIGKLPRLGGGLDPNIEAVVALKPDLVLLATSTRAAQRLEALGIKVVALEPRSLADVRRVLAQVGQVLGLPDTDGQRVWLRIETALGTIAQSIPPRSRGASVYFEVSSGPYAASEGSFIGEMLTRLGSRSIVPASMGPFPKLNPEFVVRADPDVIMIGDENFAGLGGRPGWAAHARGARAAGLRLCARAGRHPGARRPAPGRGRAPDGRLPGHRHRRPTAAMSRRQPSEHAPQSQHGVHP